MRRFRDQARFVLEGNGGLFAWVLLFSVLFNVTFAVLDPLLLKVLIDRGLVARDFRAFVTLAAAVVAFGLLVRVALWASELLSQTLRNRLTERLTLRLLRRFYRLDYETVRTGDRGYFLSRIYDEPAKIAQGVVASWVGIVAKALTFVAAGVVSLMLSWRVTLMLCLLVPVLTYLANRFAPRIKNASKTENEEEAKTRDVLAGSVAAYTTVRTFGLEEQAERGARRQLGRYLDVLFSRVRTSQSYSLASSSSLSLAEASVLVAAGWGVISGDLTLGGLFGFMNAFWKLIGAATQVIALVPELSKLEGYVERLLELEGAGRAEERPDHPRIELEGVAAGHGDRAVLRDVALTVEPGEHLLVLGPNGSGKSTLSLLLTGFLAPTEGWLAAPALRRWSALLDPFHFLPGSLKDNVRYDELPEEGQREFQRLAAELGLEDLVDKNPETELSQGQRKKAQILMTLFKPADLYLFDEPLAHVDEASKERILAEQLDRARDKTLICILHGDEGLHRYFDRIVRLRSDGTVIEEPALREATA